MLREAVAEADLVHTSNYFPPYLGLAYAHDLAVRTGKKTLFVVAEDFFDMLAWEWCRLADGRVQRWRRERSLQVIDRRARTSAASASLTLLHTPRGGAPLSTSGTQLDRDPFQYARTWRRHR
jgi:hypothetical protein